MQTTVSIPLLSASIRKIGNLLCFVLLYQAGSAQIHMEWRDIDMNLFSKFDKIDRNDPKAVEAFFPSHEKYLPDDTLGFGWVKQQKAIWGGYTSIFANLYYYRGSLVSYIMFSYLPEETELASTYTPILRKLFPEEGRYRYSYSHSMYFIRVPLPEFKSTGLKPDSSVNIRDYMSPESDIVYGERGGMANAVLPNRQAFLSIAGHLTASQIRQIMYSINPASRLTAIEYYYKHKSQFTEQSEIDSWISEVYKELPNIGTMYNCIKVPTDARSRVEEFVKGD